MKRTNRLLMLAVILILSTNTYQNPIMESFLKEVKFEQGSWTIELFGISQNQGNEFYIGSNSGIAYFKGDLIFDGGYKLITPDSLQSPLNINPQGDEISIYLWSAPFNTLSFGNVSGSQITSPAFEYSLSQYRVNINEDRFYLDKSPTLGAENDTADACGYLTGRVVDELGLPIDSALIEYDYREVYDPFGMYLQTDTIFVFTDINGSFQIHDLARQADLLIKKMNYVPIQLTRQIYPWLMTDIGDIVLRSDVNKAEEEINNPVEYLLLKNYPNPFNPNTAIVYSVPGNSNGKVTLDISDVLGNHIERLVNARQSEGIYTVNFHPGNLSSGVYLCRLIAGNSSKTIKILLVK